MKRYFFHIQIGHHVVLDGVGAALPDLAAAIDEAERIAVDTMTTLDRDWSGCAIEVKDEEGERLFAFPFTGVHWYGRAAA